VSDRWRCGLPRPRAVQLLRVMILDAALSLAGCTGPVSLYHEAEGGDIAAQRQPPPGFNLPYPNLASVPAAPAALTSTEQEAVSTQLQAARVAPTQPAGVPAPASSQALAGLALPSAAPPLPDVPGIVLPAPTPAPPATPAAPTATATIVATDGPAILLAFRPKSALLSSDARSALDDLALARGSASIRVAGFGEQDTASRAPDAAALALALHRARRIADALTAAGVPPTAMFELF
jgi:outer membrane protein OmpA-like peptidoglycan-associated protein